MQLVGHDLKQYLDLHIERSDNTDEKMSKVTALTVNNVRINDIAEHLHEHLDPTNNLRNSQVRMTFDGLPDDLKRKCATSILIYRYCIHRILTKAEIWKKEHWQYHLMNDYYSQDVSAMTLKDNIAQDLTDKLNHLRTLKDSKKIEYILELEYGKTLPDLVGRQWTTLRVNKDKLYYTNPKLHDKCFEQAPHDYLDEYKLPRGICVRDSEHRYRVVDGYSRLADAEKRGNSMCLVIACL